MKVSVLQNPAVRAAFSPLAIAMAETFLRFQNDPKAASELLEPRIEPLGKQLESQGIKIDDDDLVALLLAICVEVAAEPARGEVPA